MDYKQGNEEVMELKLNKPTKQKNLCFRGKKQVRSDKGSVWLFLYTAVRKGLVRVELIRVYGLVLSNLWSDYHGYIGC